MLPPVRASGTVARLPTTSLTMKTLLLLPIVLFAGSAFAEATPAPAPTWTKQASGVAGRLRGVSAVDGNVAWASGSGNAVLRTSDGGANWQKLAPPVDARATPLDFRDIDAIDARTAYLLSIGPSAASRIFKTRTPAPPGRSNTSIPTRRASWMR